MWDSHTILYQFFVSWKKQEHLNLYFFFVCFFFFKHTFATHKSTHIAWQCLWSSTLSVGIYVPDGNNTPSVISSSSFLSWQTRLVFVVFNQDGLRIDKWLSSSEKWQGTVFMFPPFSHVIINIIQPNYILIFPLIEDQPNWEKEIRLEMAMLAEEQQLCTLFCYVILTKPRTKDWQKQMASLQSQILSAKREGNWYHFFGFTWSGIKPTTSQCQGRHPSAWKNILKSEFQLCNTHSTTSK